MLPTTFAGGNLETVGVLDAFLHARASPNREIVFLSVGDTRDHRRQYKDPALRTISIDFILNLIANLRQLGIESFGILTTHKLCKRTFQEQHNLFACGWTSLWHDHHGLPTWSLKPGDMFLMWAQQWHYIARAMQLGYSVLRADTDVYLAENPFPILRGPLLAPFDLIVQQDFGGPLGGRPSCRRVVRAQHGALAPLTTSPNRVPPIASCGVYHGTSLLNIGLVYARAVRPGGGGALAVINGTWARFLDQIGKPRPTVGNGAAAQPQHVETLIAQPLMRAIVGELSVSEPGKPARSWTAVPGDAADVYPADIANGGAAGAARACALRDPTACARVHAERAKTPFLAQLVNRRASPHLRPERIALAPDWLFGRGCLLHVRAPLTLLRHIEPMTPISQTRCEVAPTRALQAQPAPGPAAGFLVATHFVYSMALKRKRSFRAFGWDAAGQQNRTHLPPGDSCWKRSSKAILFSHTFFAQTDAYKAVLCAMPGGNGPECVCCVGLKSLDAKPSSASDTMRMETTGGATLRWSQARATKLAQGCTDYQMFWD